MLEVKTISSQEEWNNLALSCENFNIFSSFEWGQYKSAGWDVNRLSFWKNGSFLGCTQILLKHIAGLHLGWVSSGILYKNIKHLPELVDSIKDYYPKSAVIRFNFFEEQTGESAFHFDSTRTLTKISKTINSGYTIRFDFSKTDEMKEGQLEKTYSKNNRYYLKKALKSSPKFTKEHNTQEFVKIHNAMINRKQMAHLLVSETEIEKVFKLFPNNAEMFFVQISDQKVATCLVIRFEKFAYYYLAGSNTKGRDTFSSFFMVDQLLKYLIEKNVHSFDFGGITPFKQNAMGVNRFKIGFGGKIIHYIGERNIFHYKILNLIFNKVIERKLG